MLENFLVNYFSSLMAGITLGLIGFEITKHYKLITKIEKFMQENVQKGSHNVQVGRDINVNINKQDSLTDPHIDVSKLDTSSFSPELNFPEKIKKVKPSIVAIGFQPNPNQITILGSGFAVSDDGKILSVAHLYNQLNEEQRKSLKASAMTEQAGKELERYHWIPIKLISKSDADDISLFQLEEYKNTLLKKLELSDSEKVEVGQESYFIGFPYAAQLMNDGFGVTLVVNKTIISNVKRDGVDPNHKRNWFILDAISNPGNSGCPLIDLETNKVIGVMAITFRTPSKVQPNLDIREPMHICAAKPINLAKDLL